MSAMELPVHYPSSSFKKRAAARWQYIENQNNKCCHCGEDIRVPPPANIEQKSIDRKLFPRSFFNHPIHLHHCHKTGMSIGAVHAKCNAVLWQYHGE